MYNPPPTLPCAFTVRIRSQLVFKWVSKSDQFLFKKGVLLFILMNADTADFTDTGSDV